MRHLVITGGTGGLGTAIAEAFSGPDWTIHAPGRSGLDMAEPTAIRTYFKDKSVDLLVCAAGTTGENPLGFLTETAWDHVMAVNFTGAAACAAAVLPEMIARENGHIVFISSHAAIHPPAGLAAYATAKAALLGLTRSLATRHGPEGIRVNAVLPGFMDTPMTATVRGARRSAVLAEHTLGQLNTPHAAAGFIHFLHHQLPLTSGQVFQLDSRTEV